MARLSVLHRLVESAASTSHRFIAMAGRRIWIDPSTVHGTVQICETIPPTVIADVTPPCEERIACGDAYGNQAAGIHHKLLYWWRMQAHIIDHKVIVHSDSLGGWYFTEMDGNASYRFGPFASLKLVNELVPVLFPGIPVLDRLGPSSVVDDASTMLHGNEEYVARPGGDAIIE
ncbi:hypothetical protein [Cupriavidus sp. RAF12]|uniref:hypothetical protein n=1 Tax=Cupriavidus sp. RAF12 TaxID=3233050 RepID=UPI003F8EA99E